MLKPAYPYYLANEAIHANQDLPVRNKYGGTTAAHVALADRAAIDAGIAAAVAAEQALRDMPAYARQAILEHCVERFKQRFDEFAYALCIEAGKPIKDAEGEVSRLIDTFKVAAEEAVRINGEVVELEITARARGYRGMWKRVPIGACSFIAPFNFPLNLVAHKIAPALAAGCPFVLKPASYTPIGALLIGEVLAETDLPAGAFSILPVHRDSADLFATDERLKLLSFTGSPSVGWSLKAKAGKKSVVLELGGNAACIVDADADIGDAVERIIFGAFYQSGQSCISVQRVIVQSDIYAEFKHRLLCRVGQLKLGDPLDRDTFIGPLIAEKDAIRLEDWIQRAQDRGATVLCGGERDGVMLSPAVIEHSPHDCELYAEEAFGPVLILEQFNNFDEALAAVNQSQYGLQAGLFTRDLYKAQQAWDELQVGAVIVGDVPAFRVDNMPYGGVKDSGMGREGIRYAIEHMTERRLLVIRNRVDAQR